MKLTIITADNAVYKDGVSYSDLDLSTCGIPEDVWALQWQDTSGWIENKSALVQNQDVTELPIWANACLTKWDEAKAAEEAAAKQAAEEAAAKQAAEEAAAKQAAEEAAQQTTQE
jgi:hypothetical protein